MDLYTIVGQELGEYMKTEAIQPKIISNYNRLSKLAQVPAQNGEHIVWGIEYKDKRTSGFANRLGVVEAGRSSIKISGDKIQLQNKPFLATWKDTLKNINTMLENMIKNFNNRDVVTKTFVNIHSFPEDKINKIIQA